MAATGLSLDALRDLQAAAVLMRETRGFLFLPMFVESERAAAAGLSFLQEQLDARMYPVAWPVDLSPTLAAPPDASGDLPALRIALLSNLDDAIAKLPPNAVLVLDASSSVRHALALEAMAYINHRREPLRAAGLRFILCWPAALRQELLAHAPDMWSMRTASPWITEADLVRSSPTNEMPVLATNALLAQHDLFPASTQKLAQWHRHHDLQAADLSPRDAVALADELQAHGQWADAAALAEAVCHALNDPSPTALDDSATKVIALNVLAIARHGLGNDDGALQAARLAVDQARPLAQINPAAFELHLAMSVNNLANRLSDTGGDRIGALQAAQEAMEIFGRLVKVSPRTFEQHWGMSVSNLANRLYDTGNRTEALQMARKAIKIRRRLAKKNPVAFEPDLASSLSNLGSFLNSNGDMSGALRAAHEAVLIYTRLAQVDRTTFEPALASSLNNWASRLNSAGNHIEALITSHEVAAIYKRLAAVNPAVFEKFLAGSLNNLANRLIESGDQVGALQAARDAVGMYKRLAHANPAAFECDLAMSLYNLANCLRNTDDLTGALAAGKEALGLYEQANLQHAGLFAAEITQTRQLLDQLEATSSSKPKAS